MVRRCIARRAARAHSNEDGFNVGSPIVVGKTLIIGSKTGYVFALPVDSVGSTDRRS